MQIFRKKNDEKKIRQVEKAKNKHKKNDAVSHDIVFTEFRYEGVRKSYFLLMFITSISKKSGEFPGICGREPFLP